MNKRPLSVSNGAVHFLRVNTGYSDAHWLENIREHLHLVRHADVLGQVGQELQFESRVANNHTQNTS